MLPLVDSQADSFQDMTRRDERGAGEEQPIDMDKMLGHVLQTCPRQWGPDEERDPTKEWEAIEKHYNVLDIPKGGEEIVKVPGVR